MSSEHLVNLLVTKLGVDSVENGRVDGRRARRGTAATTRDSFRGSFSDVSTPIFATKCSLFSVKFFRDLQDFHFLRRSKVSCLQKFALFSFVNILNKNFEFRKY